MIHGRFSPYLAFLINGARSIFQKWLTLILLLQRQLKLYQVTRIIMHVLLYLFQFLLFIYIFEYLFYFGLNEFKLRDCVLMLNKLGVAPSIFKGAFLHERVSIFKVVYISTSWIMKQIFLSSIYNILQTLSRKKKFFYNTWKNRCR